MGNLKRYITGQMAQNYEPELQLPSLSFLKSGKQIQESLMGRKEELQKDIMVYTEEIKKICADRELNMEELVNEVSAGNEANYTTTEIGKLAGKVRARAAMEELQTDIMQAVTLTHRIASSETQIRTFQRIYNHIESTALFKLSFSELTYLGF